MKSLQTMNSWKSDYYLGDPEEVWSEIMPSQVPKPLTPEQYPPAVAKLVKSDQTRVYHLSFEFKYATTQDVSYFFYGARRFFTDADFIYATIRAGEYELTEMDMEDPKKLAEWQKTVIWEAPRGKTANSHSNSDSRVSSASSASSASSVSSVSSPTKSGRPRCACGVIDKQTKELRPCFNTAKEGSSYCGIHKACKKPLA